MVLLYCAAIEKNINDHKLFFRELDNNLYLDYLTHICLASFLWVIGKQCRLRSDTVECGILSGSPLFAYRMSYKMLLKMKKTIRQPLKQKWTDLIDSSGKLQLA